MKFLFPTRFGHLKGTHKGKTYFQTTERNYKYIIKCFGNRSVDMYTSSDAGKFRDFLMNKGLTSSSIKRIFSSVKAIVNLCISEHGIDCNNAFSGIYLHKADDF